MSRNRSLSRARDTRTRSGSTRKRLSQNFLTDVGTARMLVDAAGVGPTDLVVEIGPGDGMLTRQLLGTAGRVLAYEKDGHYADRLRTRYVGNDRIRCVHTDFREVSPPREPFAVVANIPFGSSTDIVRWCLSTRGMTSATLLTQWEFARKHSGDHGRWTKLTVTHWPSATIELGTRVGRHRFYPVPAVDAAVLRLVRRQQPLLTPEAVADYRRVVELGFSGLGGSLASSLRRAFPARTVRTACASAGIAADLPVGFVPPDRWLAMYRALT
ncbi:23S ribosomal RNA methyltransferase Erm [Nocardia sp. GCM10030253]|uniref:23S ribosomal RNA methyltransferase Erm n=1 Tax=Nocardia sp. GCM10030253 TaxID=3273404 RepID=UPI00362E0EFF